MRRTAARLQRIEEHLSRVTGDGWKERVQTIMAMILSDAEAFTLAEALVDDPTNEAKQNELACRLKVLESAQRQANKTPKGSQ